MNNELCFGIACGETWEDCLYFDPDVCLHGECVKDELWADEDGYLEEEAYVYALRFSV